MDTPSVTLTTPNDPEELSAVRTLFREYAASLHIDLCFQMKRLYVRKAFRGFGIGRELVDATLDAARQMGYACVLLDTLDDMEAARALYTDLGFVEIPPYYHNPLPGSHYLKVHID